MKITREGSLKNFDFWSGGFDRAEELTEEQLDFIESCLEDAYPEGLDETSINDFFWFEEDTIAEWLGYESWDDLVEDNARH